MVKPIHVLIVDDERLARLGIRRELEKLPDVEIAGECATGDAAVRAIEELRPDLVFLDIQMPGLDGIEVVRRVGVDEMPAVVFVTAYDRYAVDAFEVQAVDYLMKPIDPDRLREAFHRAERRLREGSVGAIQEGLARVLDRLAAGPRPGAGWLERIAVEERGRTFLLEIGRVEWIESEGNYVRLHLAERSYLVRRTMKSLERDLDSSRFLRVRRSAIVNVDHLDHMERGGGEEYVFHLASGTEVVSARRYFAEINTFLRRHR